MTNTLTSPLIAMYYWFTLPARRRAALERAAEATEPIQVLFYHRVADHHPNPWTIGTKLFERQINWIRRRFEIVTLAEAQRRIARGYNRRPTVAITFDDGYADNFSFAVPLLLRHNIPFTYFVASHHVLESRPFDHDLQAGVPLRPNSVEELRSMAAAGVDIGSHTQTHVNLGAVAAEAGLRHQLLGSKHDLEDALDVEVRYFAFPFGLPDNMTTEAFRVAIESGYHGVCSAYGAYNLPGDDPFHIRRIHSDPEMIRLTNWLTIDRRKMAAGRLFDPGDYQLAPLQLVADGAGNG